MKIAGEYVFGSRREAVWTALLDPEILARTLPGCESLERTGENQFRGALDVAIGPVKGRFQGILALSNLRPPEGYHLQLDGSGPAGFMRGEGELKLREDGDRTLLAYDIDAQVGGRIAGVGQRLLDSSARAIAKQGLEGLERLLESVQNAETTIDRAAPGALPEAPSQTRFAARVARDVAADLVPKERRPWLVVAVIAALAAAVLLVLRSCGG